MAVGSLDWKVALRVILLNNPIVYRLLGKAPEQPNTPLDWVRAVRVFKTYNPGARFRKRVREARYRFFRRLALSVAKRAHRKEFPGESFEFVTEHWGIQGTFFATDLLELLKQDLLKQPLGKPMSLLDVGAGPGHGAAFLSTLLRNGNFGPALSVEALELSPQWNRFYPFLHDNVPVRIENLFDLPDASYDIVVCSHVIEHLDREEAVRFVRKMVSVSRELVAVICPWQEGDLRHSAHVFSMDQDFVDELQPDRVSIFHSFGWRHPNGCLGMVFRKPNEQTPTQGGALP